MTTRLAPLLFLQLTTTTRLERMSNNHVALVDTSTGATLDKIVRADWRAVAEFFAKIDEEASS